MEQNIEPSSPFEAGDHIVIPYTAAGIPYDHHAIVLSAIGGEESDRGGGESRLCIADFTADGADVSGGVSLASGSLGASWKHSVDRKIDELDDGSNSNPRHGMRILCIPSSQWRKIEYAASAPVSHPSLVRSRVEFLLKHPQLIPSYSLVDSNCECVAVWCKTGSWTTLQAEHWLGSANFGSRVAIAGATLASSLVEIPFAPAVLAAGVVAEVASGVWGDRARRGWEEKTMELNEAFGEATKSVIDGIFRGERR